MNMQHLRRLLIILIVQTSYISQRAAASPIVNPRSVVEFLSENGTSYYEGYPQKQKLERYAPYLLGHLQGSRALSSINLALWKEHHGSEQAACAAVDDYLRQQRKLGEVGGNGCRATYHCNFNKDRFPSTLIDVDCHSTRSYCVRRQNNQQVRGYCSADHYYLTTLKFLRDPPQVSVQDPTQASSQESPTGAQERDGSGLKTGLEPEEEEIKGSWWFQTSLSNKGCLCS